MGLRRAVLVLAFASVAGSSAASAQVLGDRVEVNCGSVARNVENSTINIICGLRQEQVVELVRQDRAALLAELRAIVPATSRFSVEAVARFLEILREQPVEDAKLADRFAQIAQEHVRLLQEISRLPGQGPGGAGLARGRRRRPAGRAQP